MSKDEAPVSESVQSATPSNEGGENPVPNQSAPEREEVPSSDTSSADGTDPEAPYGRSKVDGSPLKKRGRKPGGTNSPGETEQRARLESVTQAAPRRPSVTPVTPIVRDYEPVARAAATLWFSVPQMFLGEDWGPVEVRDKDGKPDVNSEPVVIKNAFKDYFESQGVSSLPPGVILCVALTGYTMSRITKPTVKSRLSNAIQWIKSKTKR